jgi:nitrogen fixation/metabolism regulation signal transduction histidine kinase
VTPSDPEPRAAAAVRRAEAPAPRAAASHAPSAKATSHPADLATSRPAGLARGGRPERPDSSSRTGLERRILLLALAAGLPGSALALGWLWTGDHGIEVQWTLTVVIAGMWMGCAVAAHERVLRPLQVIANLLGALREGDYSVRGAGARIDDALGMVMTEVNALGSTLQTQRLGALEATALLRTVMAEIDAAVFAFDGAGVLRLVNRGGERLLDQPAERLLGRSAAALGLDRLLRQDVPRLVEIAFPGGSGRWEVRRHQFRQDGRPHELLMLSDLSHALREEERTAWQRLVRVLSHEINNSLAPIKSIARSLQRVLTRDPRAVGWEGEALHGLGVIEGRSAALTRFLQAYARLTQLPPPVRRPVDVRRWVQRVADLEERRPVTITGGPDVTIAADSDQLDQLLINLVRNAVDAVGTTAGRVEVAWRMEDGRLVVTIDDQGPGLPDTTNLFVPFFTTKPEGSGIGLALSRQIAEAHGGSLALENRTPRAGCRARLVLPCT